MSQNEWWDALTEREQAAYLEAHPNSQKAKDAKRKAEGKPVYRLARMNAKELVNRHLERFKKNPQWDAGKARLNTGPAQRALKAASAKRAVPLDDDEKEAARPDVSAGMVAAVMLLAAAGAFFQDSNLNGVTEFCDYATDRLLDQAGKRKILDDDTGDLVDLPGEDDPEDSPTKAFSDDEEAEYQNANLRTKRTRYEAGEDTAGDDEEEDVNPDDEEEVVAEDTADGEPVMRPAKASGRLAVASNHVLDAQMEFLVRYAAAYIKAAAKHYHAEGHV